MEYLPVDLSWWELLELAKICVFLTDKLGEVGCYLETREELMVTPQKYDQLRCSD